MARAGGDTRGQPPRPHAVHNPHRCALSLGALLDLVHTVCWCVFRTGHYHPALKHAVRSLLQVRKLDELKRAVEAGSNDSAVAALARELCSMADEVDPPAVNHTAAVDAYRVVAPALNYECGVTTYK